LYPVDVSGITTTEKTIDQDGHKANRRFMRGSIFPGQAFAAAIGCNFELSLVTKIDPMKQRSSLQLSLCI
jgi:hypothetical protein